MYKRQAITGDEYRDESTKSTQDALGFIQPLILIFAVIALFVGSFIIANTFSMIVRESMRGYALLRSIGASPLQVFSTVIVQALLLGLVAVSYTHLAVASPPCSLTEMMRCDAKDGAAATKRLVYGCCGCCSTSSEGPDSTTWPLYMTTICCCLLYTSRCV